MRKRIVQTTQSLDIQQIFVTHHHEDHTGNIVPLQRHHQCPVLAPVGCCELMKDPPRLSFAQKLLWGERPAYKNLSPVQDELQTNNYHFQILPIPGHAPDMVALYEPNRKWLFSADLFIHTYIGYFLEGESIQTQIASIRRILALDFKVLFCSHNPQLDQPHEQLTQKLHYLESFSERVTRLYEKGMTAKEIFKQLELKENRFVCYLSGGSLSKLNMVRSVISDLTT